MSGDTGSGDGRVVAPHIQRLAERLETHFSEVIIPEEEAEWFTIKHGSEAVGVPEKTFADRMKRLIEDGKAESKTARVQFDGTIRTTTVYRLIER